jgi:hypothetical protein
VTQVPEHRDSLELHVTGAPVCHASPFANLEVPIAGGMDLAIVEKWVTPIYFGLKGEGAEKFVRQRLRYVDCALIERCFRNLTGDAESPPLT